jgi:hypothetical protein
MKGDIRAAASSRIVWLGIVSAVLAALAPMLADDDEIPRIVFKLVNYANAGLAAAMVAIRGSDKVRENRNRTVKADGPQQVQ